ncbi:MAG: hypothetical protein ACYCRD_06550 [Leptospirillum sp.]
MNDLQIGNHFDATKKGESMHRVTDESRQLVVDLKCAGCTNDQTAEVLKISRSTLERRYRREIDLGAHELHAKVVRTLFQKALDGDTAALIFICKARLGWSERSVHVLEAITAPRDPDAYSDEELVAMIEGE